MSRRARARRILASACSWSCRIRSRDRLYLSPISLRVSSCSVSIDKPVGDDEGRVLGEVLEDPDREPSSPTEELEWEALTTEVRDLLRELRPIEADILRQRFGLGTEQELTLKEIGDKYNLSRERIRQLQEQALAKMRRALVRRDFM